MARAKRKPLSFNTTLRNPNRIAGFLRVLCAYEGRILTNAVIKDICCDLLIQKLYVTNAVRRDPYWKQIYDSPDGVFTREEAEDILKASPQQHKEAGFDAGWPSRFDTWYKLIMEFGFCYYEMHAPIEISPLGKMLVSAYEEEPVNDALIQNVFLNAMARFQTSTPFRRNASQNVPLILLLQVIRLLKEDPEENGAGVFRKEISLFLCWPDGDAQALYQYIKQLRAEHGFHYSSEYIYERCLELFTDARHPDPDSLRSYIKMSKLLVETTDEYIRKMRMTGVISLRGNGRFLDFNSFEMDKIQYLLDHYDGTCAPYEGTSSEDRRAFCRYISRMDPKLFEKAVLSEEKEADASERKRETLRHYAAEYSEEKLREELELTYRGTSQDEMLKFIDAPARLEFLTSIALVKYLKGVSVTPNYPVDDEGLPRFTARGGMADIECRDSSCYGLVEVTLMTGAAQQTEHEMTSISDHLKKAASEQETYTLAVFAAPILQERALDYMDYMNDRKLKSSRCGGITAMRISEMVGRFREAGTLKGLERP